MRFIIWLLPLLLAGSHNLPAREAQKSVIAAGTQVEQLRYLLRNQPHVEISAKSGTIFVDGFVMSQEHFDRVIRVIEAVRGKAPVVNLVTLQYPPEFHKRIQREMRSAIDSRFPGNNVRIEKRGVTYFISGSVESSADRRTVESLVRALIPPIQASRAVASGVLREVSNPALINQLRVK